MKIYGLRGITHGAAKVLTVMSPAGATAAMRYIATSRDVITNAGEGQLTQYLEKRRGALDGLIQANGIIVLSKREWDRKKAALGDRIWR